MNNKYEEIMATCENNQMMTLIATRLHQFMNVSDGDMTGAKNLKLSFSVSGNMKVGTKLIVSSNNISVLHPLYVTVIKSLIEQYYRELLPYFPEIKEKNLQISK